MPRELSLWAETLPPSATVLDLGCGKGAHMLKFAELGFAVTGIDISPTAVAHARDAGARRALDVRLVVGDIRYVRFGRRFDLVFDYSVFHHLSPGDRLLYRSSVLAALKPGGLFGLVCYADSDADAAGAPQRIGRFGNVIYHATRDELVTLFSDTCDLVVYERTTLGRNRNHDAHHLLFRRRVSA